jgi:predicted nucleic acid-binding Zn ribbon protein
MVKRRRERAGSKGSAVETTASHSREDMSADRRRQLLGALGRHHTLRRLEEERIVEQAAQAAEAVADGGGGEVQSLSAARPAFLSSSIPLRRAPAG